MRNVSYNNYGQKNTHFMFEKFSPKNLVVFETMWKNMVEPDMPQMVM
jgi:hypothetical protein